MTHDEDVVWAALAMLPDDEALAAFGRLMDRLDDLEENEGNERA